MKSMKPQEPLIRVVDDEEEVRDSLKFMLECEGWLVSAYASGFDLLKDSPPASSARRLKLPPWASAID